MVLREIVIADTLVASITNSSRMWICGQALLLSFS
jgi:hypothetical protein